MIASRQDAATALAKARDPLAIGYSQPLAGIDREQPQLVKLSLIERAEKLCTRYGVVSVERDLVMAYHDRQTTWARELERQRLTEGAPLDTRATPGNPDFARDIQGLPDAG